MLDATRCPGCASDGSRQQASISTRELIEGYRDSRLVPDIERLFPEPDRTVTLRHCSHCDLRWYAGAPAGDAPFYESLQQHDWYYQRDKPEYFFAKRWVAEGDSVLEVGCGRGAFAAHLPTGRYRGLEFNAQAVRAAVEAGLNVDMTPVEDEASRHPGHYDVVCHFQVLEHVTDPAGFMQACARALRRDGTLIVAVPAEDSFLRLVESGWLNMPPHHLTRWSDAALAAMLRRCGVEPVETWHEDVAPYHADWHRTTVAAAGLKSLLGAQTQLVGSGLTRRAVRMLRKLPAIESALFSRGLAAHADAKAGHTVCIVGRKL